MIFLVFGFRVGSVRLLDSTWMESSRSLPHCPELNDWGHGDGEGQIQR
jgi:hypothetical protein